MKKKILFLFLFFSSSALCQNSNRISINYGRCRTDFYSKLFYNKVCIDGCYPTNQDAKTFYDFNIFYEKSIGADFFIPIGFGFNQKGFSERGMESDGTANNWVPYTETFSYGFISFYLGLSYDIIMFKKLTINIKQLVDVEYASAHGIDNNNNYPQVLYKSWPASIRSILSLEYRISKKIEFQLSPFYQTALSAYNKTKLFSESSDWQPYGYGMNIGILLNIPSGELAKSSRPKK